MPARLKRHVKNICLQAFCLAVSCMTCGLSLGRGSNSIGFHLLVVAVLIATFFISVRMLWNEINDAQFW